MTVREAAVPREAAKLFVRDAGKSRKSGNCALVSLDFATCPDAYEQFCRLTVRPPRVPLPDILKYTV